MAKIAVGKAAKIINKSVSDSGMACLVLSTGASQIKLLKYLVSMVDIDWTRVVVFYLDEYVNISNKYPAGFIKYLYHFLNKIEGVKEFYFVNGDALDANA